ncbi:MAG: superoxide dismutase [Candidatus Kapabacteria bacterium]|nr:superoxide dismutase [Candidatus Kapabacteria bacterium]
MDRRTFLATGTAAALMPAALTASAAQGDSPRTQHTLPSLPYEYTALEPFIDAKTMELHHSKHHKAYVDGLNKAEAEIAKARESNDFALIEYWSKKAAFHGGGHALHSLFWNIMAPPAKGGGGEPTGTLADMLTANFGSVERFKKQFTAAAIAVEGSGWAILHHRHSDGALIILQAENQHKLTTWNTTPVLAVDMWEHAYYLKHQNRRADYLAAWWNVVNWQQVQKNLKP